MKLLILLVIVVGLVAALQLAKVYQLTSALRSKREEDISEADNRLNGGLFLAFMAAFYSSFIWLMVRYGDYLPPSASAHGDDVDQLMNFNLAIIIFVFFLVNTLLFWFAAKYYHRPDRKAKFFAHDNRLELIWTVIPSIVLAAIIAYGLRTWNAMTGEASADALQVEVYSKQFDWTVRYPGADGQFGLADFNLITATNPLGIATPEGVQEALLALDSQIVELESVIAHEKGHLVKEQGALEEELKGGHGHSAPDAGRKARIEARLAEIDNMLASDKVVILTDAQYEATADKLYRLKRHRQRISELEQFDFEGGIPAWEAGKDDQIVKGEFHIPVGREVEFIFRSRDVIHSAYMPHFRAQMNAVPGVPTRFKMTPTITTDSMRTITGDEEFNYVLLCNKVCGSAHFNMQMTIVVDTPEQYEAWLAEQAAYGAAPEEATDAAASEGDAAATDAASADSTGTPPAAPNSPDPTAPAGASRTATATPRNKNQGNI
jgi:cytochrome c oxidase subunit 2